MAVLLKARETGITEGLSGLVTLLYTKSFNPHSLRENPSPLTERVFFKVELWQGGLTPHALSLSEGGDPTLRGSSAVAALEATSRHKLGQYGDHYLINPCEYSLVS